MLGRGSVLPAITRNTLGNSGNVLGFPTARKGSSSAIFENSRRPSSSYGGNGLESSEKNLGLRREVMREPQDSSNVVPCFQRGADLSDHTGGSYSHDGVIDYPRFPISEMHLGKFPDSTEFQS